MESLCFLGTHGDLNLATKSQELLVNILRVSSKIFPERFCSEMLAVPSLVEFAAQSSVHSMVSQSHKASHMLYELANAFSVNPYISQCNVVKPTEDTTPQITPNELSQKTKSGNAVIIGNTNITITTIHPNNDI